MNFEVYPAETVVRPGGIRRYKAVIIGVAALFMIRTVIVSLINGNPDMLNMAIALAIVGFVGGMAIYTYFFNREIVYKITLNKSHIRIKGRVIPWSEIIETYILVLPGTKRFISYNLVLHMKGKYSDLPGIAEKYYLMAINITPERLALIIDYYRSQQEQR